MAPPELPCDDVSTVLKGLPNADWMITAFAVILGIFLLCCDFCPIVWRG